MGGWCEDYSPQNISPLGPSNCKVSPIIGLKGILAPTRAAPRCYPPTQQPMTHLSRSSGVSALAAFKRWVAQRQVPYAFSSRCVLGTWNFAGAANLNASVKFPFSNSFPAFLRRALRASGTRLPGSWRDKPPAGIAISCRMQSLLGSKVCDS